MTPSLVDHTATTCFHCGDLCSAEVRFHSKSFCCQGCKSVYSILHQHHLTDYYCLNEMPGTKVPVSPVSRFAFLDDGPTIKKLVSFQDQQLTQVTLYLPQIHCSSCLFLLENLKKLADGILTSQINFLHKKISISFHHQQISLRAVAELLAHIGYEPHISMQEIVSDKAERKKAFVTMELGVTGFCFANIMLISFPEYLGLTYDTDAFLSSFFRYVNLGLAVPLLWFGAKGFFVDAFKGMRQKLLNIDAPIALAITITFCRSVYEILSQAGAGYLDSMAGIVFFMLVGRALQNKTFHSLRFNRDHRSYFPISVSVLENGTMLSKKIQDIQKDDMLLLHHLEIVPVDGILSKGRGAIDYSFVTGESIATSIGIGELVYAGGKVSDGNIQLLALKPFSQSAFTQLWNNKAFKVDTKHQGSFIDGISRYFSFIILAIALSGFLYWQYFDPALAWKVLASVLIVACPCSLLLSSSFVYGFVMDLFANKGLFVKNTGTIERLAKVDHVVFDKTGTLTETANMSVLYEGRTLTTREECIVFSLLEQSMHPLSRAITQKNKRPQPVHIEHRKETAGEGIEAWVEEQHYKIGSNVFLQIPDTGKAIGSKVYIAIDDKLAGIYILEGKVKDKVQEMLTSLSGLKLSLLSGDNDAAKSRMGSLFPPGSNLLFHRSPQQKLEYIQSLQQQQHDHVLMIGDGLNDAGALKQSDVGISVVKDVFSFTPACDGVLDDKSLALVPRFIKSAILAKRLVVLLFIYSLIYNIVGLSFALSGMLRPLAAAILMSASSTSIILLAFIGSRFTVGNKDDTRH